MRTIKYALNSETGEIVNVDILFPKSNRKHAFNMRKKYANSNVFQCVECQQLLEISTSSRYNIFFKHKKNHNPCILCSSFTESTNYESYCNFIGSKESSRHKELKQRIYNYLNKQKDVHNILLDEKFIIKNHERFKPDVYCEYKEHKIAFEIQLSNISISYIKRRAEFYKNVDVYLIWIIDNTSKLKLFHKDLIALYKANNIFIASKNQFIICKYKRAFYDSKELLKTKWCEEEILLSNLHFNDITKEVYFYDTDEELYNLKYKKEKQQIVENSERIVKLIKEAIQSESEYDKRTQYFIIHEMISNLSTAALQYFNNLLKLNKIGKNGYTEFMNILLANKYKCFIEFVFSDPHIFLDVNFKHNKVSLTSILSNYSNKQYAHRYILNIVKRGAIFSNYELKVLTINDFTDHDFWNLYFKRSSNSDLTSESISVLKIIESISRGEVVSFKFKNMVSLMNYAFEKYKLYWKYFKIALVHYREWNKLLIQDKKKTFLAKYQALAENPFKRIKKMEDIIKSIFKDIDFEETLV